MTNPSTPITNHLSAIIKLSDFPDNLKFVEKIGNKIIKKMNLTVVKVIKNKFEPIGITYIYLLSESHFAIHTWPEYETIHLDLLSCKQVTKSFFDKTITEVLKNLTIISYKSEAHSI